MKEHTLLVGLCFLLKCIEGFHPHINAHLYGDPKLRNKNLIYPEYTVCSREGDLRLQKDYTSREGNWSGILNRFLFFSLADPDSLAEQILIDFTRDSVQALEVIQTPILWFLLYLLPILISFILIPFLGAICCFIFGSICYAIVKSYKFLGRHLIIRYEKLRRIRENIIVPRKHRNLRRKFQMPYFFRNFSDEDVPHALERQLTDDSKTNSENEEEERLIEEMERNVFQNNAANTQQDVQKRMLLSSILILLQPESGEKKKLQSTEQTQIQGVPSGTVSAANLYRSSQNLSRTQGLAQSSTLSNEFHFNHDDDDEYETLPPIRLPLGVKVQTPGGKLKMHIKRKRVDTDSYRHKEHEDEKRNSDVKPSQVQVLAGRPKLAALEHEERRPVHKLDPDKSQTRTHEGIRLLQDQKQTKKQKAPQSGSRGSKKSSQILGKSNSTDVKGKKDHKKKGKTNKVHESSPVAVPSGPQQHKPRWK